MTDVVLCLKTYPSSYSVFEVEYLRRRFTVPMTTWTQLEPFWADVALAITKTLIYTNFDPRTCVADHHHWRKSFKLSGTPIHLDSLRFLDLLTRDRGFKKALADFNKQVASLKYGAWLEPIDHDSPNYESQIAMLGQFVLNAFRFLLDSGFLVVSHLELGVQVIKPYFISIKDHQLTRLWLKDTLGFFRETYERKKRYPALREIAAYWGVSNETLIVGGFTYPVIVEAYRHWRRFKRLKVIKELRRTYDLLTDKDLPKVAQKIARRMSEAS